MGVSIRYAVPLEAVTQDDSLFLCGTHSGPLVRSCSVGIVVDRHLTRDKGKHVEKRICVPSLNT